MFALALQMRYKFRQVKESNGNFARVSLEFGKRVETD